MASFRNNALRQGYLVLLVLAFSTFVSAIELNVCASFNTAQTPLNVSIYQTNGLCTQFCVKKNYAFSITQQNSCWCSNYYPDQGSVVDTKKCNTPCPAWTPEDCGGPGLFGYILLNEVAPSGTSTAPASSTTGQSSSTSSSSASTTPNPSSSSGEQSSGSSSGLPKQTADPSGDQTGTTSQKSKSGLSTGAIVGIVVGIVGGLAVLAAALFLFLRRRRQNQDEYRDDPSVRGSSSGMVGSVPPEMSINGGSPASPVAAANRNSTIQIDPRMDPFKQGLYIRGSHESLNTLRDDHDYSRRIQRPTVLRATNPDPEEG
ncbi:cell wall integrity and stress response component 4 [Trichoderma asperellum]|uniref:Cell wall integrity and stress response component 4 n=1 Tax=Trichoderma asperellum TaxID=101201 RepID=A0A6V8QYG1_TRIAP|nr:cell wall integrity and stress response component 4 [Trichoderma asperellum]